MLSWSTGYQSASFYIIISTLKAFLLIQVFYCNCTFKILITNMILSMQAPETPAPPPTPAATPAPPTPTPPAGAVPVTGAAGRIFASPYAKTLAAEKGISLQVCCMGSKSGGGGGGGGYHFLQEGYQGFI